MKNLKVGGKINLFREGLGLTLEDWAKKCRVNQKTMERICLRRNDPSGRTLLAIIKHGGMSPDILEIDDFNDEGLV